MSALALPPALGALHFRAAGSGAGAAGPPAFFDLAPASAYRLRRNNQQIAVLGASAGVGRLVVEQGLGQGHRLVALARRRLLAPHPHLTQLQGSVTNPDDLRRALATAEVVIVALDAANRLGASTVFTEAATALVQVVGELLHPPPVIALTGFGTADTPRYQPWLVRTVRQLVRGAVYRDQTAMEQLLTAQLPRWEIVRPARLTNGPLTGRYQAITAYSPAMKIDRISRADVADFLLRQAESLALLGQYPALTY